MKIRKSKYNKGADKLKRLLVCSFIAAGAMSLSSDKKVEKNDKNITLMEAFEKFGAKSIEEALNMIPSNEKELRLTKKHFDNVTFGKFNPRLENVMVYSYVCDTLGMQLNKNDLKRLHLIEHKSTNAGKLGTKAHELSHDEMFDELYTKEIRWKTNIFKSDGFKEAIANLKTLFKDKNIGELDISIKGYDLLNQYDEVRANIYDLLIQRELYMKSGNLDEFSPKFKEYANAVKIGIVNPHSENEVFKDLEKSVIVNSVTRMWAKEHRDTETYKKQSKEAVRDYILMAGMCSLRIPEEVGDTALQGKLDKAFSFKMMNGKGEIEDVNLFASLNEENRLKPYKAVDDVSDWYHHKEKKEKTPQSFDNMRWLAAIKQNEY